MNSNQQLASACIAALMQRGMRNLVFCAGSFNSPVFQVAASTIGLKMYNHFEERGAAFFGLGLSRGLSEIVGICTTSGTAAAECLPAVIEAYYSNVRLVVITADRQKNLSGSGYPQAIWQADLFGRHCPLSLDLTDSQQLQAVPADIRTPLHINLRFSEPIFDDSSSCETTLLPEEPLNNFSAPQAARPENQLAQAGLQKFLDTHKRTLIVAENLPAGHSPIAGFIEKAGLPVIAEARSGLHAVPEIADLLLRTADLLYRKIEFDSVLRIGSVPASDLWRALEREAAFNQIPVCSVSQSPEQSGLSRHSLSLNINQIDFQRLSCACDRNWSSAVLRADQLLSQKVAELIQTYPLSEPAMVSWYSSKIPDQAHIFLGNSLPVRHWNDFAIKSTRRLSVDANRAANGIDGQIASFLGSALARGLPSNWALLGDLTFLYDCNSLMLIRLLPELELRLAIIQNYGGRIFERLGYFNKLATTQEEQSKFLNVHAVNCSAIAEAFGISGLQIKEPRQMPVLSRQVLIEIIPDFNETREFMRQYKALSFPRLEI